MCKKIITSLLFLSFQSFYISSTEHPYGQFNSPLSVILFSAGKLKNQIVSRIKSKNNESSNKHIFDLPLEIYAIVAENLTQISKMQLSSTCKKFQEIAISRSLLLSSLNATDYTRAMVHFSRKNDIETIKFLITNETEENKERRKKIMSYFHNDQTSDISNIEQAAIEIYKKDECTQQIRFDQILNDDNTEVLRLMLHQNNYLFYPYVGSGKYNLLQIIIYNNYFNLLNVILESNIDHGKYALEYAIAMDNIPTIEFLIKSGVNLHLHPKHNALTCAIYLHRVKSLETLLRNSANPNILDKNGRTPLMIIALFRSTEEKKMLDVLSHHNELDYNIRTSMACTALEYAIIQHLQGSRDPYIKDFLYQKTSLFNKCCLFFKIGIFATTMCTGMALIMFKLAGFSDNNLFTLSFRLFCLTAPLSTCMIKFFFEVVCMKRPFYDEYY